MKKNITIFMLLTLCSLSVAVLNSCESDFEETNSSNERVEFLKQKAKEFSEKYGVDVQLNENKIREWADGITIEQIEDDIRTWREFLDKCASENESERQTSFSKRKLSIKRTKTLREEGGGLPSDTTFTGDKRVSFTKSINNNTPYHFDINCRWIIGSRVLNHVWLDIDYYNIERPAYNYQSYYNDCSNIVASYSNGLAFNAQTALTLETYLYRYKCVAYVTYTHNEHNGIEQFSLHFENVANTSTKGDTKTFRNDSTTHKNCKL